LADRRLEVRIANLAETSVWVEADEPIPAGVQYVRVTFKGPRAAIGFEARITGRDGRRMLLKIAARDTRGRAIFKRWSRGQNVSPDDACPEVLGGIARVDDLLHDLEVVRSGEGAE